MFDREVFTLPHIVWLDSTGLQVIFQSSPGLQVPFFLVGAQPNYGTNWPHSFVLNPTSAAPLYERGSMHPTR